MKKYIYIIISVLLLTVSVYSIAFLLKKIGFENNDIVATIISLYSLMFVAYTAKITNDTLLHTVEHDIRSVTPYLQSWVNMEHADKEITISLHNSGIGPACIQRLSIGGIENAIQATKNIVAKQLNSESIADNIVRGNIHLNNYLLAPNTELLLVQVRFNDISDSERLQILEQVSRLKIHVEYLDIYELQFLLDRERSEKKKPARPYTFDSDLSTIYKEVVEPYKFKYRL